MAAGAAAPTPSLAAATQPPAGAQPGCGTWVLQQVATTTELDRKAAQIKDALSHDGIRGLSVRVPWSSIDQNFTLLDRAAALAHATGKELSVRFLAGQSTPARVFNEGAAYYTANGAKIPKPFSDGGAAGNPVFERNYEAVVTKLATWSRANGVTVLHLPWYGYKWAEIYNGSAVQAAPGYNYQSWLTAHQRLLDIGLKASGQGLSVEFALSGDWGGQGAAAGQLADRVVQAVGPWSSRAIVQGNGLGKWNSTSTNREVYHAKQMVDGGEYDWSSIYQTLRTNNEAYVEVYLTSFTGTKSAQLYTQAKQFAADRC